MGNRVWITRTLPGADRTAQAVRRAGFQPIVAPLLVCNPDFEVESADLDLDDVAALAFTSVNGLAFADLTPRRDWPVFAVGDRTAQAARARGFTDVASAGGDARDLATLIARAWNGRRGTLLVPTATHPAADLSPLLQDQVPVRSLAVYETRETQGQAPAVFDLVTLHSRRAAEILARSLSRDRLAGCTILALSQTVAEPLDGLGIADLRIAARPDEASLIAALGKPTPAV